MLVGELLRRRQGGVRSVKGDLEVEGLLGVALLQLFDGFIRKERRRVAFFFDLLIVPPPIRLAALVSVLEVIHLRTGEAIEVIKAIPQGARVSAQVPLADERGRIACFLQARS